MCYRDVEENCVSIGNAFLWSSVGTFVIVIIRKLKYVAFGVRFGRLSEVSLN